METFKERKKDIFSSGSYSATALFEKAGIGTSVMPNIAPWLLRAVASQSEPV